MIHRQKNMKKIHNGMLKFVYVMAPTYRKIPVFALDVSLSRIHSWYKIVEDKKNLLYLQGVFLCRLSYTSYSM
jgi:hypothetical protein